MITNNQLNSNFYQIAAHDANGNVFGINLQGPTDLGDVANVSISGGTNGQFLTTDGTGNLSWSMPVIAARIANGTSNVNIAASNGNITMGVNGNSDVMTVTGTGANINGTLNATGAAMVGSLTTSGALTVTGVSTLGSVGNVKVTGGTTGQVLSTDGTGNLSWTTLSNNSISNGTSNVSVALNSNITFGVNGTEEVRVTTNGVELKGYTESVGSVVVSSGTFQPDVSLQTIYNVSAQGNFTFNGFTNPVAGQSGTFIITQDSTGNRTMTSSMRFASGVKTLSTLANTRDIMSAFYDGTTYYAVLTKDFR